MKKLFSLFVPLMALLLTLSPQTAKAAPINPASTTTATPFTIYHTGSESSNNGRFEISYEGTWGSDTKPIFQYRILKFDGTQSQTWTDATVSETKVKITTTKCTGGNTYFILASPTLSPSYPSGWAIQFRLKSGYTWNVNKTHWITFKFRYNSTNTAIGLTGNIMSLVANDFENVTEIPSAACFYKLFSDDTSSSSNVDIQCNNLLLPATTLKDNCYENMFSQCVSFLKKGPNIMAFNPESDCASAAFKNMFNGCSGMTTLTTNFMTWGSGAGTENWLNGCSACKTVNCPSGLDVSTKDASHIGTAYTSGSGNVSPSVYVFNVSENSGTWDGTCQADKYYTTAAPTVPDPNEDGFAGWYTASTGGSAVTPGSLSAPSTVTKYYAQFSSATTFNVAIASYNSDHGTVTVAWNDGSAQTLTSGNTDILNATPLTITAVPNAGYKLTGLTITPSGGVASDFTSGNTHTLTAAITVTATFEAKSFTLAINSTSHGSITCSDGTYVQGAAAQPIAVGTTVTFTATPDAHYELTGWTGAVSGTGLEKSLTVGAGMDEALTVGATFALEQFTINAASANLSMGSVTGGGTYSYGAAVTLTATANDGYRFVEWSDGNTSNPRNFTASENLNLTATFGLESVDQTVKVYQGATADTTKILYALTAKTVGGTTYTPIDLGYGIAWSDKNMGATDLKPAGNYYAWGNLSSGTSFNANTYYNGSTGTAQGWAAGATLPNDHDAANQTIGSYWHIPSPAQWTALLNNCSVSSYTYTGANGNSITLPATGYYNTNGGSVSALSNTTHYYYWTNTKGFYSSTTGNNSGTIFEDGAITGDGGWDYDGRLGNGLAIRPVYVPTFTIYTLTINVGSYKYVYKCQSGQSITVNACATELGATFNEWSEDHNTNATRTFTVTADATYTATFAAAPTYSLAWVSSGSAPAGGTAAGSYIAGTTITAPTTSKTGYTFSKWRDETNGVDFDGTMPANNVTYTAQWTPVTYNLTYTGLEGASNSNPATYTIETATFALANPGTRAGYTFTGWTCGGNPITQITLGSTGDKTITANWSTNTHNVSWVTDGNALTGTYTNGTTAYGTTIVAPNTPTKNATAEYTYAFNGWSPAVDATMPDNDVTYTAQWTATPVNYTLTWDFDGGSTVTTVGDYTNGTVAYGTTIVAPADPTKEGCTFNGWDVTPAGTMPAANTTYTAQWTACATELHIVLDEHAEDGDDYYDDFQKYNGVTATTVTLNRQFGKGKWATLCLPFEVSGGQMTNLRMKGRVYEFRHAEGNANDGNQVTLFFAQAEKLTAGKAYIVNANAKLAELTQFVFHNVTINTSADQIQPLNSISQYNDLADMVGYSDGTGTIQLVGTLRLGTLKGSNSGNTYMGLKDNKIYYPSTSEPGSTVWAYRGVFRSTSPLGAQRIRIVVEGDEGEEVTELEVINGELQQAGAAKKFVQDGVLYIEREGVIYDATGKLIVEN